MSTPKDWFYVQICLPVEAIRCRCKKAHLQMSALPWRTTFKIQKIRGKLCLTDSE